MVIGLQTFLDVALIDFIQFVFGHLDQNIIVYRLIIIPNFNSLANRQRRHILRFKPRV